MQRIPVVHGMTLFYQRNPTRSLGDNPFRVFLSDVNGGLTPRQEHGIFLGMRALNLPYYLGDSRLTADELDRVETGQTDPGEGITVSAEQIMENRRRGRRLAQLPPFGNHGEGYQHYVVLNLPNVSRKEDLRVIPFNTMQELEGILYAWRLAGYNMDNAIIDLENIWGEPEDIPKIDDNNDDGY